MGNREIEELESKIQIIMGVDLETFFSMVIAFELKQGSLLKILKVGVMIPPPTHESLAKLDDIKEWNDSLQKKHGHKKKRPWN